MIYKVLDIFKFFEKSCKNHTKTTETVMHKKKKKRKTANFAINIIKSCHTNAMDHNQ